MIDAWYRPLADVRAAFAEQNDDLRHILLTIDAEVLIVPREWSDFDSAEGFARWGLPSDAEWRWKPGVKEPLPVIVQIDEADGPMIWRHTFYGTPSTELFEKLSYRAVRCLADAPAETLQRLRVDTGLPAESPSSKLKSPHMWWVRALHSIGQRHHHSDLRAVCWPTQDRHHVLTRFDKEREARRQGRAGVGEFSYSILRGNVFECSVWAIDLILGAVQASPSVVEASDAESGLSPRELPPIPAGFDAFDPLLTTEAWAIRHAPRRILSRNKSGMVVITSDCERPEGLVYRLPDGRWVAVYCAADIGGCVLFTTLDGRHAAQWQTMSQKNRDTLLHWHCQEVTEAEKARLFYEGQPVKLPTLTAEQIETKAAHIGKNAPNYSIWREAVARRMGRAGTVCDLETNSAVPIEAPTPETTTASSTPSPLQSLPDRESTSKLRRLKEPKREAFAAYRLHIDLGWDQTRVAEQLSREFYRPFFQGTVSRMIKQVKEWRESGNPWPESIPKIIPTDPGKLDLGPRSKNYARRKTLE